MDDYYSATQVQAMVREMDYSKTRWKRLKDTDVEAYKTKLRSENKVLYDAFPSLWKMHSEDKLDGRFFDMLQLKRRIEKGELTNEQASTIIGQKLFSQYVKPVIDSNAPPEGMPMSYEDYYKQTTQS